MSLLTPSHRERFLRDAARATKALVLTGWSAACDPRRPPRRLPASLTSRLGKARAPSELLTSLCEYASSARLADGGVEPGLVSLAMRVGVEQAATEIAVLRALQEALGLERQAARIEAYDVSHDLNGAAIVGARAVLTHGMPHLEEYACSRVLLSGPMDDAAAMKKTLRTLARPSDVLLVDGGTAQLEAAYEVAEELGIGHTSVLALIKGREGVLMRTHSGSKLLPLNGAPLQLLQRQSEEAHANALFAHRWAAVDWGVYWMVGGEITSVGLAPRLIGYDSAVSALAHSGARDAGADVERWTQEEARKWWASSRPAASGARSEAAEHVLEATAAVLEERGGKEELKDAIAACGGAASPRLHVGGRVAEEEEGMVVEEEVEEEAAGRERVEAVAGTFRLVPPYAAPAELEAAVAKILRQLRSGRPRQMFQSATGTDKTFMMARIIEASNRPTLVLAPNEALAAQLFAELKSCFPHNSVVRFMSHFDYDHPESYMPASQLAQSTCSRTSDAIDLLRHEARRSLSERRDTVVVATLSCIFELRPSLRLVLGQPWHPNALRGRLEGMKYVHARGAALLKQGDFGWKELGGSAEAEGGGVQFFLQPAHEKRQLHVMLAPLDEERAHTIEAMWLEDKGGAAELVSSTVVYPASPDVFVDGARINAIQAECQVRTAQLRGEGKDVEADRLERRVRSDVAQLKENGWCQGMENYARHMCGRAAEEPPSTLLDHMPEDWLLLVDESHITEPLLDAMHRDVRKRKRMLVSHGLLLPSATDNRPLTAAEMWKRVPQAVLLSATPGEEAALRGERSHVTELPRPQSVYMPRVEVVDVSSVGGLKDHLLAQIKLRQAKGSRTLVSCFTKRSAEELADFLNQQGLKAGLTHWRVKLSETLKTLGKLRSGEFDVLVGCKLARKGLDFPEVELVVTLDAEMHGVQWHTQTIGLAARHTDGTCLMYTTDGRTTKAMADAIAETERQHHAQQAHNEAQKRIVEAAPNDGGVA